MAGRASIVGAAETSVGKVREHNEDAHFIDPDRGIFAVCDGMGGHAAGEVASGIAVKVVRDCWASERTMRAAETWLEHGTIEAKKALLAVINAGVCAAHDAIMAEATRDRTKGGMGTTIIGALVIGGDIVFAQSGDSRAYMVRDGIAMQLTEDHTLLARLLAAGVDVDTSNEGSRFKSMLTNALGIGTECKTATFVVPLADGDRFLLCSDGITEYVQEAEIGEVLMSQPSPARGAQKLVELALQRGGGDNATALVIRVLEAGETARPAELLHRENKAINACPLWAKVTPQGRLRALRIALPRDYPADNKIPAQTLNDRVAWIIVDGEVEQDGVLRGPGSLLYPEALLKEGPLPDKDGLAVAQSEVRVLALRCDDFHEVCEDDAELGELLLAALAAEIETRKARPQIYAEPDPPAARMVIGEPAAGLESAPTDPNMRAVLPRTKTEPSHPPSIAAALPAVPKAQSPGLMRKSTPPTGKPTAPMGVVGLAPITGRETTQPPPVARRSDTIPDGDVARGPTAPLAVPRTSTKDGPMIVARPAAVIRGISPAERLIVPRDEANAAEDQLDRALDGLGDDTLKGARVVPRKPALPLPAPVDEPGWPRRGSAAEGQRGVVDEPGWPRRGSAAEGQRGVVDEPGWPRRGSAAEGQRGVVDEPGWPQRGSTAEGQRGGQRDVVDEPEGEVVIEADEPPLRDDIVMPLVTKKARSIGDNSEPEISIERFVELEVEEPMNDRDESSSPEIMILTPGRAITADDTKLVAGSIDTRNGDTRNGDTRNGDTRNGDAKKR